MRIAAALLSQQQGVAHGFFGREGGVSLAPYDSLNMALRTGDAREAVLENRRRVAAAFGAEQLLVAKQVHGTRTVPVAAGFGPDEAPEADALVTREKGVLIAVTTADCAPILLADAEAGVVGAAHAGWRGALDGIVESVVRAMVGLGADPGRIAAAVGPCIQRRAYEVGAEFEERFLAADPESEHCFAPGRAGKPHFDLEAYVCLRLRRAGLSLIQAASQDTASQPQRYFSYRRTTLAGGGPIGTQASAIMLA